MKLVMECSSSVVEWKGGFGSRVRSKEALKRGQFACL